MLQRQMEFRKGLEEFSKYSANSRVEKFHRDDFFRGWFDAMDWSEK